MRLLARETGPDGDVVRRLKREAGPEGHFVIFEREAALGGDFVRRLAREVGPKGKLSDVSRGRPVEAVLGLVAPLPPSSRDSTQIQV